MNDFYILECPNCHTTILIKKNEINCCIFRCGILKETGLQINPHLNKSSIDTLKEKNAIWGCGSPFFFKNGKLYKCGYI